MFALYIEVRRKQSSIKLKSKTVAKQAVLYLAALYWSYLFTMINNGFRHIADVKLYGLALVSGLAINLQGVWFLLIYNHFHIKKKPSSRSGGSNGGGGIGDDDNDMDDFDATGRSYNSQSGKKRMSPTNHKVEISMTDQDPSSSNTGNGGGGAGGGQSTSGDNGTVDTSYEFNIFDGTNASSSPFSQFIYEGDSDDEAVDQEQSEMWNTIQNHV